jgi:hypothetical protein
MANPYNSKVLIKRDKRGKEVCRQIAMQRVDKRKLSIPQIQRIYEGLLRNRPHDKIRILVSNPYQNYLTIKGTRDYEINNFDDDDYWQGVSQPIRDKLSEIEYVHFIVYK